MANLARVQAARDALALNREEAIRLVQTVGLRNTRELLEDAEADLVKRLKSLGKKMSGTFTETQLRVALAQVREVLQILIPGMRDNLLSTGEQAAELSSEHMVEYLTDADAAFRGAGAQPLALKEAAILDRARTGVQSSILRRLASSGEPIKDADAQPHPAKMGILQRYGVETVGHFERQMRLGLLTKKPWSDIEKDITSKSTFLQQAPAYWATRIVRTEAMGAYNRAGWEGIREADEQLGDMCKIISSVFDDRTGADSYAVHGEIRRVDEAFESWFGFYVHPPDRPNDRSVVVPHRIAWSIPPALEWKTDGEILARWREEGHKGKPPSRPKMTTIPLSKFGK